MQPVMPPPIFKLKRLIYNFIFAKRGRGAPPPPKNLHTKSYGIFDWFIAFDFLCCVLFGIPIGDFFKISSP